RNRLRLEAKKETQISIGNFQDQSAVVKHAVVAGVRPDVTLVHVDVVNAVETIGVAELDIDRHVQIPIKLCAERINLSASSLALVEIQGQQILQVVTAPGAGRRQRATVRPC